MRVARLATTVAVAVLTSVLLAAAPAPAQNDGATVTHFNDCFSSPIFVGGQAFYNVTYCIEGINVYNFTESSSGNQSYLDRTRLQASYSGECQGGVTNEGGSHTLVKSPEEGPFQSHLRFSYHHTLNCGNGAVVTECDIEQHFQIANGEIIFSRDETICT